MATITIRLNSIAERPLHVHDFFRSISSHASAKESYEIIYEGHLADEFSNKINFIQDPNFVGKLRRKIFGESEIEITLPDNCLVLGKDWDKYILYNLEHGKPIDEIYVKRWLKLVGRPDNGIFPGLSIKSVATL